MSIFILILHVSILIILTYTSTHTAKMTTFSPVTWSCIFLKISIISVLCVFFLHVCIWTMCIQCPQKSGKNIGSPVSGVTEGCELWCGHWDLNLGLLQGQHAISPSPVELKTLNLILIFIDYLFFGQGFPSLVSYIYYVEYIEYFSQYWWLVNVPCCLNTWKTIQLSVRSPNPSAPKNSFVSIHLPD